MCLLFSFLFFTYSVLGVEMFGTLECSDTYPCEGFSTRANFRNFGYALMALYKVCTGDNWIGMLKDALRDCRPDDHSCADYMSWAAPLVFISFVIMVQFVLINLVVASIMQALGESKERGVVVSLPGMKPPETPEEDYIQATSDVPSSYESATSQWEL